MIKLYYICKKKYFTILRYNFQKLKQNILINYYKLSKLKINSKPIRIFGTDSVLQIN
jgi:hypothetical protein